jgi:peptide-methionine (S)-S-oxide reductase
MSAALVACTQGSIKVNSNPDNLKAMKKNKENLEIATLGAGCFWCIEAVFQDLIGVEAVISGYTGGHVKNPTYKEVCNETTGHAEVAQIHFDPTVISFGEILEVFWATHDPTTLNRQGNDRGTQYRSAIFYHSEKQKEIAEKSKTEVASKLWDDPIVTEITAFEIFYEAENYHQNFYSLNPNYGYCRAIINPKVQKFREKFADKLKPIVK